MNPFQEIGYDCYLMVDHVMVQTTVDFSIRQVSFQKVVNISIPR